MLFRTVYISKFSGAALYLYFEKHNNTISVNIFISSLIQRICLLNTSLVLFTTSELLLIFDEDSITIFKPMTN